MIKSITGSSWRHRLRLVQREYGFFDEALNNEESQRMNNYQANPQSNRLHVSLRSRCQDNGKMYTIDMCIRKDLRVRAHAIDRNSFSRELDNQWGQFRSDMELRYGDRVKFTWITFENLRTLNMEVMKNSKKNKTPASSSSISVEEKSSKKRRVGNKRHSSCARETPASSSRQTIQRQSNVKQKKRVSQFGDLDAPVNALDLYIALNKLSSVANVHIGYDIWGQSLCYGYINFYSPFEAAMAMSVLNLNHTDIKGKPMRIMWCERNPLTRKTGKANLFVKNIDYSIDSARLDLSFSKFGTVVSCKVAVDENGKSKGFGFVQFDQEESVMKAINSLHDTLLEGKKLYVSNFMKSSQRHETFTNLYVKSLKKEVYEEKFSKFGKVNSAAIMRDNLGISKGYGFVSFESPEDAKRAMESLNGTPDLACGSLFVGRGQKKAERDRMMKERLAKRKACSVHVHNLHPNVDEGILKSHFSVFGKVVHKVMRYPNINSAWVTFSSPSEAKSAVASQFGLNSIHNPLYGAKVQCMEAEKNYPFSVEEFFPPNSAAGNIVHPSSNFKGDEGLSFFTTSYGNAIKSATYENHKLFPETRMISTCSSRGSSSTAINITRCKNLRVLVPKSEAKYRGRTSGIKMKMNDHDHVKSPNCANRG